MSLVCDVTGKTDRVEYLPVYMQTDKTKKVCFAVALKMEKERLQPKKEQVAEPVIEPVKEVTPKPVYKRQTNKK